MEWSTVHFRARARDAGRELPRDAVDLAVSRFIEAGTWRQSDLSRCIEAASSIAELSAPDFVPGRQAKRAEEQVTEGRLTRTYGRKLAKVRRELFGSPQPPFQSLTEAAAWIRSGIRSARPLNQKEIKQIVRRLQKLSEDLTERIEKSVAINLSIPALAYLSPDGEGTMHAKVPTKGPLPILKSFAEEVTSKTALSEATVVAWVLSGVTPRAASVEVSFKPSAVEPRIEILIRADELKEGHLRSARKLAKSMLHPGGSGPRAERDRVLLDILRKLGGIPRHNRMQFYRQVHEALPAKHRSADVSGTRVWISRLKKRAAAAFAALPSQ